LQHRVFPHTHVDVFMHGLGSHVAVGRAGIEASHSGGVRKQYHGALGGTTKFEGIIEALKAAVYDYIGLCQPELYVRTTREIADWLGKTLKFYSSDAKEAIENLELPVIPRPGPKPTLGVDDADDLDLKIWEKEVDEYMAQRQWLKENLKTAYIVIWGQRSDTMRARAEATTDFKTTTSKDQDIIKLLKVIKQIMFCNDTVNFLPPKKVNRHADNHRTSMDLHPNSKECMAA